MCAGDYPSFFRKQINEVVSNQWPVGVQFNNVGRTDAAKKYPDVVQVRKHFQTSGQDVLIMGVGQQTFLIPVSQAELIYQRADLNRPEIF